LSLFDALVRSVTLDAFCSGAVHILAGVAAHAVHALEAEVRIARDSLVLAKVLIPHAASMAGCAVLGHGWGLINHMPIHESATHVARLADVTISATRVAGRTVIAKHRMHRFLFRCGAHCFDLSQMIYLCQLFIDYIFEHKDGSLLSIGWEVMTFAAIRVAAPAVLAEGCHECLDPRIVMFGLRAAARLDYGPIALQRGVQPGAGSSCVIVAGIAGCCRLRTGVTDHPRMCSFFDLR
jgi:hypothetical protein